MRNLKILGLSLVAVFALTAVAASAASAHEITAGAYTAEVSGTQTNTNTLSNGVRSVTCANATLTGTLAAASPNITITPAYSNCTGNAGTTATVDTNGCAYVLTPTNTSGLANNARLEIECPVNKEIEITIWASGKAHTEVKLCTLGVEAQSMNEGIIYTNLGGTSGIQLAFNLGTVDVKRLSGTELNCGKSVQTAGTYTGTIVATAKHGGVATSLDAN